MRPDDIQRGEITSKVVETHSEVEVDVSEGPAPNGNEDRVSVGNVLLSRRGGEEQEEEEKEKEGENKVGNLVEGSRSREEAGGGGG